jgi:DNA-binding transcriptional ArsR family regulator
VLLVAPAVLALLTEGPTHPSPDSDDDPRPPGPHLRPMGRRPPIRLLPRALGAGRAFVLAEMHIPSTTSNLAHRVNLSRATVSEHLAILRDAGLVTAERRGREVLYRQTPLAAALLHSG